MSEKKMSFLDWVKLPPLEREMTPAPQMTFEELEIENELQEQLKARRREREQES